MQFETAHSYIRGLFLLRASVGKGVYSTNLKEPMAAISMQWETKG
jgi:hypothetical protein